MTIGERRRNFRMGFSGRKNDDRVAIDDRIATAFTNEDDDALQIPRNKTGTHGTTDLLVTLAKRYPTAETFGRRP